MMNLRLTEERDVFGVLRAVHVGILALTACAALWWLQAKRRRWSCWGIIAQVTTTLSPPFLKSTFLSTAAILSSVRVVLPVLESQVSQHETATWLAELPVQYT